MCVSHLLKVTRGPDKAAALRPLVELLPQQSSYLSNKGCWLCTDHRAAKHFIKSGSLIITSSASWLISKSIGAKYHLILAIHQPCCSPGNGYELVSEKINMYIYPTALSLQWPLYKHLTCLQRLPLLPHPWLAVLLLYVTLPKCNLLKHALTRPVLEKPKSKPETRLEFFWRTSRLHALTCV